MAVIPDETIAADLPTSDSDPQGGSTRSADADPVHGATEQRVDPQILGDRFCVTGVLGRGGMGVVYRVVDTQLGDRVKALKLLPPALAKDATARERMRREVGIAQDLDHPHLVRVHDVFEDGDALGFSMPLLSGHTLRDHLLGQVKGSPLVGAGSADRLFLVAVIAEQLGAAVDHLHGNGLVHRDIKPANVMLSGIDVTDPAETRVHTTLMDLGIVQRLGKDPASDRSGTDGYRAPELVWGHTDGATVAADIYAFGLLVYHALTGVDARTDALISPSPGMPTPSACVTGLPAAIDGPVMACLNGDPEQRPGLACEVSRVLREEANEIVRRRKTERPAQAQRTRESPISRRRVSKSHDVGVTGPPGLELMAESDPARRQDRHPRSPGDGRRVKEGRTAAADSPQHPAKSPRYTPVAKPSEPAFPTTGCAISVVLLVVGSILSYYHDAAGFLSLFGLFGIGLCAVAGLANVLHR